MKHALTVIVITYALFALTGCQILEPIADPTKTFVLNTSDSAQNILDQAPLIDHKIALLPIQLPKYLDRPHIVTRTGKNNIDYSQFLRWAEPLEDGIARIMIAELENNLGNGTAYLFPYLGTRDESKILKLRLEILSFEVVDGKNAVLKSRWEATANDDHDMIASGHGTIQSKVSGSSPEAHVQAMSHTLSILASNIASALKN